MLRKKLKHFLLDYLSSKISFTDKDFQKKLDEILDEIFLSERVFNNLRRIIESDYYLPIYLETEEYFLKYFEIITKISAFSNYLTDIIVRNPEFLTRFISSGEFHKDFSFDEYDNELEQQISIFKSFDKKIDAIRRFKRLHLLRIGLRDILNLTDIEQTMLEYSYLTITILDRIFSLILANHKSKMKLKNLPDYTLISLGKLGGLELNFSSDVDLICVFDNPEESSSSQVLEFYDKVVKDFIQICSELKDGSSLYRIDFRLRPDGKYSPLARSLSYYQIYYETYGRDWERQMLLKMNFVSGNKSLFEKFYKALENFIFPRTFLVPPQIFIQKFRNVYLENISSDTYSGKLNLKHFKGGIRDVEFSVQAQQLLYGGKFKNLRTQNTIEAIKNLAELKLIDKKFSEKLIDSYKFLRRIENYIQLMDDRQLHSIPQDQDKFQNLVKYLGLKDADDFNNKLKTTRQIISSFSAKIFEPIETNPIKKLLEKIKVDHRENFEKNFQQIVQLVSESVSSFLSITEKDEIKDFQIRLIKFLSKSNSPEKVLNLLKRFCSNLNSSFQVIELLRNKKLLKTLLDILDNSEYISQILISDKKIIDAFFSGELFSLKNFEISKFDDEEIRFFIFLLIFNFYFGKIKVNQIGKYLSDYIDCLLRKLIKENLEKAKIDEKDFALIGLGSYGTREMHFKSDIDLLFIFSNDVKNIKAEKFSLSLLSDIRDKFKLLDFFQVDSKLRPEGSVSKLSWTIDELQKYINTRMRIWEFQSYTKMRLIDGNKNLYDELIKLLKTKIEEFNEEVISSEIKRNRSLIKSGKISFSNSSLDLKNSNGGLMDLQFLIQNEILRNKFIPLVVGKSFNEALQTLAKSNKILKSYQKIIKKNYEQIFKMILVHQLLTGKRGFTIDRNFNSKFVKKIFRINPSNSIFNHFKKILDENFEIIKKVNAEIFE